VEIVGLNDQGVIIDVLWSSSATSKVIALEERIFAKRTKIQREWKAGFSSDAAWLLKNGSTLNLRGNNRFSEFGILR
jgi:hypothetical protein